MADRFLAAGSTDLNTTASWRATVDGATGQTVPTANDLVYIAEGSQIVSVNPTTLNVDLNWFEVTPEFSGSLGVEGTPLTIGCSGTASAECIIAGSGPAYYITAGTAGIDRLRITVPARSKVVLASGTFAAVEVNSGNVFVNASAVVTAIRAYGGHTTAEAGTAFTSAVAIGSARIDTERGVTTGYVGGEATVRIKKAAASGTVLRVFGGMLNLQASGMIASVEQYAGIVTPAGARVAVPVTAYALYGGVCYEQVGQSRLTIGTKTATGGSGFQTWTNGPGGKSL